jgi:hypothetical protein
MIQDYLDGGLHDCFIHDSDSDYEMKNVHFDGLCQDVLLLIEKYKAVSIFFKNLSL